jgi:hypothetical protein
MIFMSRTLLKLRYVRASFQVANVLIVSSSFLGLLGGRLALEAAFLSPILSRAVMRLLPRR